MSFTLAPPAAAPCACRRALRRPQPCRAAVSSRGGAIEDEVYIDKAPATLLRSDGQDSGMRARFEARSPRERAPGDAPSRLVRCRLTLWAAQAMIRQRQNEICSAISALDGTAFREDSWTRPGGGGGISRVIQGGNVRARRCQPSVQAHWLRGAGAVLN